MRALGALGMSAATSLAFENSGTDSIRTADVMMFNLRTLIRNAIEAYETEDRERKDEEQIAKDVEADMVLIAKWLEANRLGKPVKLIVYCPSYAIFKLKFKYADRAEAKTEKQKERVRVVDGAIKILLKKYEKLIEKTVMGLPDFKGNGVVMTHHVIDLVDTTAVTRLYLFESRTGAIKPYTQWYTKLTGGDELHYMPFNRLTIQIFGDRSTNFRSSSIGIKNLVKKLAADHKWTPATTMSRVRSNINDLPQGVDRAGLLMML